MNFNELVRLTSTLPCFQTSYLSAGNSLSQVRLQLDRWEKAKKVIKITKSVYSLAPPYIKIRPTPFAISSILRPASYISLQSALGYYGVIPEYVPGTVAITTGRPWQIQSPLGRFIFRHIKTPLFWGYTQQVIDGQHCFIATPEKALLDLLYITPGSTDPSFITSLRLQNCDRLDSAVLCEYAKKMKSKKVERAITFLLADLNNKEEGYQL
jgi:predicted transcriptional regulator of viral defense system